ncbi:sugar phosphate isomerase/epimerase [Gramella lutea]|uniref:Sugar phosphate isomerase/epimerase n=1 Tax=Christiangramia lutea TaxID=1607951 RepID=A0A9X2A8S1_9FLAO|nr:sugar phosphate isomerase/epimerase family protein [Christiangramia lutea]MCH4822849.1 sugar phosphate isomerase/epimerase [Christiangramia lutea]
MNFTSSKTHVLLALCALFFVVTGCKQNRENKAENEMIVQKESNENTDSLFFELSLAQWSLHKAIQSGKLDPLDFAEKASELGFSGIEYVSTFYSERINEAEDPEAEMKIVLDSLKSKSEKFNIRNVLIMVDGEGDLADPSEEVRNKAVENHKKWVDAAEFLGCHSIRVNTFGTNDPQEWHNAVIDGLTKLSEYAATKKINILVENHGWLSSDITKLMAAINEVNMENCGTLPDTGNFCTKRKDGQKWGECEEHFDPYKGVKLMLPKAEGVSAKSEDFPDAGMEIDYEKMMQIVKDSGYEGFIGIEYESDKYPEDEGILHLKNLVLKSAENIANN